MCLSVRDLVARYWQVPLSPAPTSARSYDPAYVRYRLR